MYSANFKVLHTCAELVPCAFSWNKKKCLNCLCIRTLDVTYLGSVDQYEEQFQFILDLINQAFYDRVVCIIQWC
jgi:hypothetical protein